MARAVCATRTDQETSRRFAPFDESNRLIVLFFLISILRERLPLSLDEAVLDRGAAPGCQLPGRASHKPNRLDFFQRPKRLHE